MILPLAFFFALPFSVGAMSQAKFALENEIAKFSPGFSFEFGFSFESGFSFEFGPEFSTKRFGAKFQNFNSTCSGCLNTEHSKSEPIQNPSILMFKFRMIQYQNDQYHCKSYSIMEPVYRNPRWRLFCQIWNGCAVRI